MPFSFQIIVRHDWIDYNGHMRDSNYGLVFSLAVDALQDEIGFDAHYRTRTGCTIYLVEDHKVYLKEVHGDDLLQVETFVLGVDDKRFHLLMIMSCDGEQVCIGEFIELHVQQSPKPKAIPMPTAMRAKLAAAEVAPTADSRILACSQKLNLNPK